MPASGSQLPASTDESSTPPPRHTPQAVTPSPSPAAPAAPALPSPNVQKLSHLDLELLGNSLIERYFSAVAAAGDPNSTTYGANPDSNAAASALANIRALMSPAFQITRADGSRSTKVRFAAGKASPLGVTR